jgi:23S rRNA (cytosine1962-C5)-methyltransferase
MSPPCQPIFCQTFLRSCKNTVKKSALTAAQAADVARQAQKISPAVLSSRGVERFYSGHPWIYRSDVAEMPESVGFGPVTDQQGQLLAWAALNHHSQIALRLLCKTREPLDAAAVLRLILARLRQALRYRAQLGIDGDAYRMVGGEADLLPGLVVDRYGTVLVIQNNCAALEPILPEIVAALVKETGASGVLGRFEGKNRLLEGLEQGQFVLYGEVPEMLAVREGDIRFLVEPFVGQKTGAFLDQRQNRLRLGQLAYGQSLDVFSYHGSFGLHLATQAQSVLCIDSSAPALARAEENAALNGFDNMQFIEANAFDFLRERERAGAQFDTISLDPPAFAKAKRDLDAAYRAYKEVNLRAMRLLAPGGILGTSSCSFHFSAHDFDAMLRDAVADTGRQIRVLERAGAAPDHPELLGVPESHYLKFVLLQALE